MVKKAASSKNKKIQDELKAIRQLKNAAVILSNNDLENAFLSNVAGGESEALDENVASDVLSKISGQESGFKRLEAEEGGTSRQTPTKSKSKNKKIAKRPVKVNKSKKQKVNQHKKYTKR